MGTQPNTHTEKSTLETITNFLGRKIVMPLALATGIGVAGCNAPHYHEAPSEEYHKKHEEYVKETFGDQNEFAKSIVAKLEKKDTVAPFKITKNTDKSVTKVLKTLEDDQSLSLIDAYSEVKEQVKYMNQITDNAKVYRLVAYDATQNAEVDVLVKYAEMTPGDASEMRETMKKFGVSIGKVSKEQRDQLKDVLAKNAKTLEQKYNAAVESKDEKLQKQLKTELEGCVSGLELVERNEEDLKLLDKLYKTTSALNTLEGKIDIVVGAQKGSAAIQKSLYGIQQYDEKNEDETVQGQGRKCLNKILEMKLGGADGVCSPRSKVAQSYKNADMKLEDIYKDNLKNIFEEASDWGTKSLHKICNDYLANNLSIAYEAYMHGLITKPQLQSVVRVVTADAFKQMGEAAPKEVETSAWDIILAISPIGSIYTMIRDGRYALSQSKHSEDSEDPNVALARLYMEGSEIEHGVENREWITGYFNKTPFWAATASTGVQLVGTGLGLYFGLKNDGGSGSSGGGATGTPPVGGGGTTVPGTGN